MSPVKVPLGPDRYFYLLLCSAGGLLRDCLSSAGCADVHGVNPLLADSWLGVRVTCPVPFNPFHKHSCFQKGTLL